MSSIPRLVLADQRSGSVYGIVERGEWIQKDSAGLRRAATDRDVWVALEALGVANATRADECPARLEPSHHPTIGRWGQAE